MSEEQFLSQSVVKVVVTEQSEALYFSRAPIPFPRGEKERMAVRSPTTGELVFGFKHYGLYAFTPRGLLAYSTSRVSVLESIEKLEQLRVLESGARVGVHLVSSEIMKDSVEVDTPADLERARMVAQIVEG
jgi:3-deoxy-manno-octulosonate cytidylyltransferase (CMP-KDO synthetase)